MSTLRRAVFFAGFCLFVLWFWPNIQMLTGDQDGVIRLVLVGFFSIAILLRLKPRHSRMLGGTVGIAGAGLLGACLAVSGLIFQIHQFEWLGIILVLYACLRWSLPDRWSADIVRSLFVLYWIHPLPGRLFGWFEVLMQQLSVWGSEWMLQILNVRVWAEGVYLRTGHHIFGVPEACSGMRTAVTMLICVLGVGILMRHRWWETLIFMFIGSVQVLILNIARITFMILWSDRMPGEWGSTFLHDSLGFFLIIAIFLIQVEMSWWKVRVLKARKTKERIENDEQEEPDRATALPHIWAVILRYTKWALLVLLIVLSAAYAKYKRRPSHRAAMISGVIDGLLATDAAAAESAVNDALGYTPRSRDLLSKKAHILLLRRKYDDVLSTLDEIPQSLTPFETVMKSWALMSLKKREEAMDLIRSLPENAQQMPGVAIVKAEYAVALENVTEVAENVVLAAGSASTVSRVRALYPYLASREQWPVIAKSNSLDIPHEDVNSSLIVIQAYIKVGDTTSASIVLRTALKNWPGNPHLLNALYYMVVRRPGDKWGEKFAENFVTNVKSFSSDEAAKQMGRAFALGRPDLAWLAYRRLEDLDPSDPELYLSPVRYGSSWFNMRRAQVGVREDRGKEMIDLTPFIKVSSSNPFLKSIWDQIPLVEELIAPDRDVFRVKQLEKSIKECERRISAQESTDRIEAAYAVALGIAGRFDEAHKHLDTILEKHPERAAETLLQHAEFYHVERRWEESYESLRTYFERDERPSLAASLMLIDNLMRMNLGVCALEVIRASKQRYPDVTDLLLTEASLWHAFGFQDRALHILGSGMDRRTLDMRQRLLFETGRYREAEQLARAIGAEPPDLSKAKQKIALVPAEAVIRNNWPEPFSREDIDARIVSLAELQKRLKSPLLVKLAALEETLLKTGEASTEQWVAAGRNAQERAAALYRLTVLASRLDRKDLAKEAALLAARHLPESPILWRVMIGMSEGNEEIVAEALKHCPSDPEIWLANIAVSVRSAKPKEQVELEVREVLERNPFPVETYVRAGDFLLRKGYRKAAYALAEATGKQGGTLLAADMFALRCALMSKDQKWAMEASLRGVQHALDPSPFYAMIVGLKSAGRMADAEMIEALEHLEAQYPDDSSWAEYLGMVYFEKKDMVRALNVLSSLISRDTSNLTSKSFVLAAEAARIEGKLEECIDILKKARNLYPNEQTVLNNLVYALAQTPATLDEAKALLPELEKIDKKAFHVYDTLATVHMQDGRLSEARKYMEKALKSLNKEVYSASEVKLNAAELLIKMGETSEAEKLIREIWSDSDRPHMIDRRARRLLESIEASR